MVHENYKSHVIGCGDGSSMIFSNATLNYSFGLLLE